MWCYKSKIGMLYIKRRANGRFGFFYGDECWCQYSHPQAVAEMVAAFTTDCYEWDCHHADLDFPYPRDLSEWENT